MEKNSAHSATLVSVASWGQGVSSVIIPCNSLGFLSKEGAKLPLSPISGRERGVGGKTKAALNHQVLSCPECLRVSDIVRVASWGDVVSSVIIPCNSLGFLSKEGAKLPLSPIS